MLIFTLSGQLNTHRVPQRQAALTVIDQTHNNTGQMVPFSIIILMRALLGDSCRKFRVDYQPELWSQRLGHRCARCQKNLSYQKSVSPCRCYLFCHQECFSSCFAKEIQGMNTQVVCLVCKSELILTLKATFTYQPRPSVGNLARAAVAVMLLALVVWMIMGTLSSMKSSQYIFLVMYLQGLALSVLLYWLVLCCRDILFRQEIAIKEVGSTNLDIQTSAFQDMEMATNDELTSEALRVTI